MMPQTRVFPCLNHYTLLCSWGVFSYTLGCMRFLEYMGFVLAVFPLKYGFIMVQIIIVSNDGFVIPPTHVDLKPIKAY